MWCDGARATREPRVTIRQESSRIGIQTGFRFLDVGLVCGEFCRPLTYIFRRRAPTRSCTCIRNRRRYCDRRLDFLLGNRKDLHLRTHLCLHRYRFRTCNRPHNYKYSFHQCLIRLTKNKNFKIFIFEVTKQPNV